MSHEELRAAVAVAYEQFKVESKVSSLDDYDAMLFQIAFTYGVEWANEHRLRRS